MKIAIAFDNLGVGGIETVGVNYIRILSELGHDVDVYNLHPKLNDMVKKMDKSAKYIPLSFDRKLCPELYSYGVKKWWWGKYVYPLIHIPLSLYIIVRKIITRKRYDLAIAFSGHINDLTFVAQNIIKSKKKIVWCHGTLMSYLAICDAYPILYKKVDAIITLSDQQKDHVYGGHDFLYNKTIKTIYNPVFIKEYPIDMKKVDKLKHDYGEFILMVARATEPKDHKTVIRAIKLLREAGIDKKVVFVGDGERLQEYKDYARELNIDDLCVFEGKCLDVQNYIYASHINVLASMHEGLPTVIAEAMAFGKPCIMTKSDGGELSDNGKYCMLTAVGNAEEIKDALITLYTDEEAYARYSELSLDRFTKFEPDFVKKELQEILMEI